MRKPYDFLVVSFTLLLNPSTIPDESAPFARNQLRINSRWLRRVRATFFIGSSWLRIVLVHHWSRICTVPWDDAGAFLRFSVTYVAPDETAEDADQKAEKKPTAKKTIKAKTAKPKAAKTTKAAKDKDEADAKKKTAKAKKTAKDEKADESA